MVPIGILSQRASQNLERELDLFFRRLHAHPHGSFVETLWCERLCVD